MYVCMYVYMYIIYDIASVLLSYIFSCKSAAMCLSRLHQKLVILCACACVYVRGCVSVCAAGRVWMCSCTNAGVHVHV